MVIKEQRELRSYIDDHYKQVQYKQVQYGTVQYSTAITPPPGAGAVRDVASGGERAQPPPVPAQPGWVWPGPAHPPPARPEQARQPPPPRPRRLQETLGLGGRLLLEPPRLARSQAQAAGLHPQAEADTAAGRRHEAGHRGQAAARPRQPRPVPEAGRPHARGAEVGAGADPRPGGGRGDRGL